MDGAELHHCADERNWHNGSACRLVNIGAKVPLDVALPLYGYVMPVATAVTLVSNSFVIVVLSTKYLRTPTNVILLAIALTELFIGASTAPWFVYYYTLGGYRAEQRSGLPKFWCEWFPRLALHWPTIFHTAATWLTVYLAAQRYIYVRAPKVACGMVTMRRTVCCTALICLISLVIQSPLSSATYNISVDQTLQQRLNGTPPSERLCVSVASEWLLRVGPVAFYNVRFWFEAIGMQLLPSGLLFAFTAGLVRQMRRAARRRRHLHGSSASRRANSLPGLRQNTRMLCAVIGIFLLAELPVGIVYIIHVLAVTFALDLRTAYYSINVTLIARNVLLEISYPFRLVIYCCMSQQFRVTARHLFSKQKLVLRTVPYPETSSMVMSNINGTAAPRRFTIFVEECLPTAQDADCSSPLGDTSL